MKKLNDLESLRGFASIYVALGHWILSNNVRGLFNLIFRFGQEAVIIFFILSGFVIAYSYQKGQNKSLRSYFIKRFRRIYFPLICAFIVSIVVVSHSFSGKELLGNILMLQDFGTAKPGNIVEPFLGNSPLWSLSYEWIFYLIFPFIFPVIGNHQNRVHFIGVFSLINLVIYVLFPNHIFLVFSYFFIWWTGLELSDYYLNNRNKVKLNAIILYYCIVLLLLGFICYQHHRVDQATQLGTYPYILFRHFGFAFICFLGAAYLPSISKGILRVLKPFRIIAPVSYAVYIIHYPICVQADFGIAPYLSVVLKVLLVAILAWLIEIVLQPVVNRYLA